MVSQLARLHAAFWQSPRFAGELSWVPSFESRKRDMPLERFLTGRMIRHAERRFSSEVGSALGRIADLAVLRRDSLEDSFYRKTKEARDRLDSILEEIGEKATATGKNVKKGMAVTEDQIRENPWAAVGIAAGAGLLLGLLINRSR